MISTLTSRQRQILDLLVLGRSTNDIAQELFIAPATARNHIQTIMEKLGVSSRLEAVAYLKSHSDSVEQQIIDWARSKKLGLTIEQENGIRRVFDPFVSDTRVYPASAPTSVPVGLTISGVDVVNVPTIEVDC